MSSITAPGLFVGRPRAGLLVDIALAAAAFVGVLAQISHGGIASAGHGSIFAPSGSRNLDVVGVVLTAASTLPLVAWRRDPLGVFTVTAAASVLLAGLDYPLDLALGPAVALYLLAASRQPGVPWTRAMTVTVAGLFGAYLVSATAARGAFPGSELLHSGLAWSAAWFAGERTRLRREQLADLEERAARAEREAEREHRLAAAEERARIARDLHDSAGHAISVIAVRAGAARLRHHQDPDRSLVALEAIEELARQTADEIDQIVHSLRDGGAANGDVEAPVGLTALDTLIARNRAAGLAVSLDASGTPPTLASATDQAAYRILQEALTNAARHGAGSARIQLAYDNDAVDITVTNPALTGSAARSTGGHGLIGMHERATLLGGDLDIERTNGTFRVHARLPYTGHGP